MCESMGHMHVHVCVCECGVERSTWVVFLNCSLYMYVFCFGFILFSETGFLCIASLVVLELTL